MQNVLVTGGAGFIGSHLVDALIEQEYNVYIIDDFSTGKRENVNSRASLYELSVQDDGVAEIFKKAKFSYVFHLAAQTDVRKSCSNPLLDAESNIIGTLNILSLCRLHRVKKFIFSSSGGVIYGDIKKSAREADLPRPVSPYGISKLAGELYVKFFDKYFPYTILRYSNVYGERQDPFGEAGVVSIFINNMLKETSCTLYGYGKPVRDYVYVGDIVKANILSVQKGDNETINIGTGKPTSVEKLYSMLKGIVNHNISPVYKPLREGEINSNYLCVERAKDILGWQPSVSLENGLSKVVQWLKATKG
ncbi:MAG: NAD-dependent epimerase/dehydratase family protein [bacterium]|nr:NAD-dependent epimerase/dehydratase family protein [bacterium]